MVKGQMCWCTQVRGKLSNGEAFGYLIDNRAEGKGDKFVGRQLDDGFWVKAKTLDEREYVLCKCKGFNFEHVRKAADEMDGLKFKFFDPHAPALVDSKQEGNKNEDVRSKWPVDAQIVEYWKNAYYSPKEGRGTYVRTGSFSFPDTVSGVPAPYIIVSDRKKLPTNLDDSANLDDPAKLSNIHLIRYLVEHKDTWNLERPDVIISVTGGALSFDMSVIDKDKILKGIMHGTRNMKPLFITGGTDSGVMKYVGEARAQYNPMAPLIGIAPAGPVLSKEKNKSKEKKQLLEELLNAKEEKTYEYTMEDKVASLDKNHSHFILVENGEENQAYSFGCENVFRGLFEKCMSEGTGKIEKDTKFIDEFNKSIDEFNESIEKSKNQAPGSIESNTGIQTEKKLQKKKSSVADQRDIELSKVVTKTIKADGRKGMEDQFLQSEQDVPVVSICIQVVCVCMCVL